MSGSNSSIAQTQDWLDQFNFTGGYPTGKDLAPSVIFAALYILSLPVVIWRLSRRSDRCLILIRPTIFVCARTASLILRAVMSKTTYGAGELVAELVLISVGYLFLIEPVIGMWQRHLSLAVSKDQSPRWVRRIAMLLRLSLLATIIISVVGSARINSVISNPSLATSVQNTRKASYILSLVVAGLAMFALITTTRRFGLAINGSMYIGAIGVCLIIIGVYRVVQVYSTNPHSAARSSAAFWILQILFEFIAYCLIMGISIPAWFPKPEVEKRERDSEMGQMDERK